MTKVAMIIITMQLLLCGCSSYSNYRSVYYIKHDSGYIRVRYIPTISGQGLIQRTFVKDTATKKPAEAGQR